MQASNNQNITINFSRELLIQELHVLHERFCMAHKFQHAHVALHLLYEIGRLHALLENAPSEKPMMGKKIG